jgi:hypothetical protein
MRCKQKKWKNRKVFQQYKVTNATEIAQFAEILKQKVQAKAQRIRRYEKREIQCIQKRMFKENTKKFSRSFGATNTEARKTPSMTGVQSY